MSSLELVPDPKVLLTQTAIFLSSMYAIKKLMLEPYLRVRSRREEATVGSQEHAKKFNREGEDIASRIERLITECSLTAKTERENARVNALKKRKEIITAAEQQAKQTIDEVKRDVQVALAAERKSIPEIVSGISDDMFLKVTS
jgi:F0F1-type ATP synthase membrane subunit b/b'